MAYCNKRLILASGSPRRRELLDKFGIDYEILPAQGEESAPPELTPGERVKALAAQKAEETAHRVNDAWEYGFSELAGRRARIAAAKRRHARGA